MSIVIGQTLLGRYRVEAFLGRGGMSEVYKVWDGQRSVHLAMKLLREDLAEDMLFLRRFRREAQTLARLQHPNIVRFYGLEQDGPLAFMLMDYVEGTTLRREILEAKGPLGMERAVEILRPVCAALHYAHTQGMVHCDVKPGNIMIDRNGTVMLTDFGIARMTDAATATMVGLGTPAYMAPELVRGQDPTAQTDIYALGVVLYEMLTGGERPFTGDRATGTGSTSEKVRWEQLNLPAPSPRVHNPALSGQVEAVVLRCLEKSPEKRHGSVLDVLSALEGDSRVLAPVDLSARAPRAASPAPRPTAAQPQGAAPQTAAATLSTVRRRWPLAVVAGIAGLAAVVLLVLVGLQRAGADLNLNGTPTAQQIDRSASVGGAPMLTPTPKVSSIRPSDTPNPDSQAPGIEIREVTGAGDLEGERVLLVNTGGAASMAGWTLGDGRGHQFVFPDLVLYAGGAVSVHTGSGADTAADLYWGLDEAIWFSGLAITLRDAGGEQHSTFLIPGEGGEQVQSGSEPQPPLVSEGSPGSLGTQGMQAVAVSPDGRGLAVGDGAGVHFYDLGTFELLWEQLWFGNMGYPVWSLAFSPDGRSLATGSADISVMIWDAATGDRLRTLEGHAWSVECVAFSPDGRRLASKSWDGTVIVWDPATGERLHTLDAGRDAGRRLVFSPDGRWLVLGGSTLSVWDPVSGERVHTTEELTGGISSLAFSPDGRWLASGLWSGAVVLWDVVTWDRIWTQDGLDEVSAVAFSPNGRWLASGSWRQGGGTAAVILWDAATGNQLQRLETQSEYVEIVTFTSDGSMLVSGSYDGTVMLWGIDE
jgi:tRNA A-37 threonylcarbamoyl transferase component Bud32